MANTRPLHPGRTKKTAAKRRTVTDKPTLPFRGGLVTPTSSHYRQAGGMAAGLLIVAVALATWAMTWILGARNVVTDILHREAGGISGLEMAAFGAFAFGFVLILGMAWRLGIKQKG